VTLSPPAPGSISPELLAHATPSERLAYLRHRVHTAPWDVWLDSVVPAYTSAGFAPHHAVFWQHVWAVRLDQRPRPFVAVWPRGGAKSTSMECALVAFAARQTRRYALYVCESQDQADDHVSNIGSVLESGRVAQLYPQLGERAVSKFGAIKGWRRNRLRTASGFTVDALGLDSAARGIKLDEMRPDVIVIDDLDRETDSPAATRKKVLVLTQGLLPAGSEHLAVFGVQNLVHGDSIFSQLCQDPPEFLQDRVLSGPVPAMDDLLLSDDRRTIVQGTPTWEGQDTEKCQHMLSDMGATAFLTECQQDVTLPIGGMFSHLFFKHCQRSQVPDLLRTVCWVDPAVSTTDQSDSMGIQVDGITQEGVIYRLFSWEGRTTPEDVLRRAILAAEEYKCEHVGVETDQGGDTWQTVYRASARSLMEDRRPGYSPPRFKSAKAGAGHGPKAHRASLMVPDYERNRIVHVVGTHHVLERALGRFPLKKPYDLVDAAFWSWRELRPAKNKKLRVT
jgi:hypothetical protein